MKMIASLFDTNRMQLAMHATKKSDALRELVDVLVQTGEVEDGGRLLAEIEEREEQSSTAIGFGIAVPHKVSSTVRKTAIVFGRSANGIAFGAPDAKPVHLFFLTVGPQSRTRGLLQVLSRLSRLLHAGVFRDALMAAEAPEAVVEIISREEAAEAPP